MKVMRAPSVLCVCALLGCAPDDERWHGDASFTPDERAAIEAGSAWTAEHVGAAPPVFVWDGEDDSDLNVVRRRVPPAQLCADVHDCTGYAAPRGGGTGGRVWLAPGRVHEALAAHEFGHVYGLRHHEERGLMQPVRPELVWTAADEASR